ANELSRFASSKVPALAKFGTLERLKRDKSAAKLQRGCLGGTSLARLPSQTEIRFSFPPIFIYYYSIILVSCQGIHLVLVNFYLRGCQGNPHGISRRFRVTAALTFCSA